MKPDRYFTSPLNLASESLRGIGIPTEGQPEGFSDHSRTSGAVTVHFDNIEDRLCRFIDESEAIVGCVAWLTSEPVIITLGFKPCQIIVQKEDFLRPDFDAARPNWKSRLRRLYETCGSRPDLRIDRTHCPFPLSYMNTNGETTMDPIRCVGNHNSSKATAPRSHHKFIVRCSEYETSVGTFLKPEAVWTGSYNFTKNATKSFENAVVIADEQIADAYLHEWAQVAALSEPLDWTADWVEPEWRIGS